jgi:serine protease Do
LTPLLCVLEDPLVRRIFPALILVATTAATVTFAQTPVAPSSPSAANAALVNRAAIDRAIAAVLPSLVRVSVVYLDQQGGREVKGLASGSGTIISADGYVVTNHHVVGRPRRIYCTLSTREEIAADLVGTDPLADIAVLKLRPATPRVFKAARFGNSDVLDRGTPVLAMGSPLALSQSVTLGIVSNPKMIMPQTLGPTSNVLDGEDVGTIVSWIGHDAAIYPGNSGGPLVNLAGEIVGVNEISYGLGGAIPSRLAKQVADAIIKDGRVKRAWTGIEVQPRITGDTRPGALVSWVVDRSPGSTAGVQAGDLLVKVNDQAVNATYAEELPNINQLLLGLPIGQPAKIVVRRGTADQTLTVTPTERPAVLSAPSELRSWGITLAPLTPFEAREYVRDSTDGARVASLRPGGPSDQAKPPLRPNDIIVEVEGQPVKTVTDVEKQTQTALTGKPRAKLLVGFERDHERYLTVVEAGESTVDTPPREAKKAWVPVDVQVLTPPLAERIGLKGKTGVRVTRLLDSSTPLRMGDIILAIDGEPVRATTQQEEDLFAGAIRRYRVGQSVTLTIVRDGKEMPLPVTLGQTRTESREMKRYDDPIFEFRVRDVSESDREDPSMSAAHGVLVESVAVRGWAALGRLNGGDLILALDGKPVKDIDDFQVRMDDIHARKPATVVFEIQRGIRTMFVELQPAWK